MFVEVQNPKAAGSRLSFVLRITDGFQLMQGEAEVVAVREAAAGQSPEGMSIRFRISMNPASGCWPRLSTATAAKGVPICSRTTDSRGGRGGPSGDRCG